MSYKCGKSVPQILSLSRNTEQQGGEGLLHQHHLCHLRGLHHQLQKSEIKNGIKTLNLTCRSHSQNDWQKK